MAGNRPWAARLPSVTDVAIAAVAALITIGVTLIAATQATPAATVGPGGWALLLTACLVLLLRRRLPTAVAITTLVVSGVYYLSGNQDGPIVLTSVIALYTVAAQGLLWRATALGAAAIAGMTVGELGSGFAHLGELATFLLAGWIVAAVALGGMRHARAVERREVERRIAAVEQARAEQSLRLAGDERLRIARELHDALGHHLSLISVQATASLHGLGQRPASASGSDPVAALGAIKDASGDALRELSAVLDILRQDDAAAPMFPASGLSRLDALVQDARAAGLEVRTTVERPPRPLARQVDFAAYRIVQEALTNVTRHADASRVNLSIRYRDEELELEVRDDGKGRSADPGNGLRGMAERANLLGGQLAAGPVSEGGFLVRANLPLGAPR